MKGVSFLYYTQEQIDRANQADLVSFLQSQGEQLTRAGNEYRWKRHDKLDRPGKLGARRVGGQWHTFLKKKQPPESTSEKCKTQILCTFARSR